MPQKDPEGPAPPPEGNGPLPDSSASLVHAPTRSAIKASGANAADLICGVDRALVESFLILVKDYYKRADMATFFLEQKSGIVNLQGITNVRDVLSHLVTMLSPDTPDDKRLEQLYNAEEHLRRSINEPYEIALNELLVKFSELYEAYKAQVLPIKESHFPLSNAPNSIQVEARLHEVQQLNSAGRASKAKNLWTAEWEDGVLSFTRAYELLTDLYRELEEYHHKAQQIERTRGEQVELQSLRTEVGQLRGQVKRESTIGQLFHVGGYALALVIGIIAAILAVLLYYFAEIGR
jgi:hypothetical protein